MTEHYDVVIAGAGPAGGQCARDLAARGYEVLVLEVESEEEFPRRSNKSTGGTFPKTLSAFGIPNSVVTNETDYVVLESPNEYIIQYEPGAVLDFADFKRFLVKDGRKKGAQYQFDARVSAPILENGKTVGVRYSGGQEAYGDVVIDATGPAASLAKRIGVSDLKRQKMAVGVEYEMDGVDLDHRGTSGLTDAMMIHLDQEIAPGGYSWIFHTGDDTAKVGLCFIQYAARRGDSSCRKSVDSLLQDWIETDPRLTNAEHVAGKHHRGSAHIQMPGDLSTDNFLTIGDTVPTVDPVFGEGIHACMKSGRVAAIAVDRCFLADERDTSAANLSTYDELWNHEVASDRRRRLLVSRLLYRASNDRYDELIRDLKRTDEGLSEATLRNRRELLKLAHTGDVPLLSRVGKHLICEKFTRMVRDSP